MNSFYRNVLVETLAAIIAGLSLSILFFIFSDFIHTPPNISGQWYFVNETQDTTYEKFKGLKVYYKVMLVQQGNLISGHGEKIKDELDGEVTEYSGANKIPIKITGYLKQNFISKDKLNLYYSEEGVNRISSTFHNLIRFNDTKMVGSFDSTIANSSGKTNYSRLISEL